MAILKKIIENISGYLLIENKIKNKNKRTKRGIICNSCAIEQHASKTSNTYIYYFKAKCPICHETTNVCFKNDLNWKEDKK